MNDRKKHVVQVAKQLFIDNGFQATSIQDILNEAHISKGTFYNYFSSKNECLLAILRDAYYVSFLRRNELAIGKDLADRELLSEQIHIRLSMNREQNLLPLVETVVHSSDHELREFVQQMHYRELAWIARRLVDIYGVGVKAYALDCASLISGAIQHSLSIWKSATAEPLDTKRLVDFVMQRMEVVIPDLVQRDEQFLSPQLVQSILASAEMHPMTRDILVENLRLFLEDVPESTGAQFGAFLVEELSSAAPRGYMLESVVRSFREAFEGTDLQLRAIELSAAVWLFIQKTE